MHRQPEVPAQLRGLGALNANNNTPASEIQTMAEADTCQSRPSVTRAHTPSVTCAKLGRDKCQTRPNVTRGRGPRQAADVHEPPSYANDARGATAGWSADTAYDAPPTITAVITKVPHDARHSPPAALITVMRC